MADPLREPDEPRTAFDILLDLLDLCATIDKQRPVYRAIPTQQIRDAIVHGWRAA